MMTNTRDTIRQIWRECFDDSNEFVEMFFSRVYRDEDALTLSEGGTVVSSMLLQRYGIMFHGREEGLAYVCGAATRRGARGRGLMARLMREALNEACNRGDTFCALIPAHEWLYGYYSKFGFAPVFLVNRDRYTALHPFNGGGSFRHVTDIYEDRVYEAFSRLEHGIDGRVIHSRRDFLNILDDLRIDGGAVAVMADDSLEGRITAFGFATSDGETVRVTDLIGETPEARTAALRQLRGSFADLPFTVAVTPGDGDEPERLAPVPRSLSPRGMGRIVNAARCLEAIAAARPDWKCRLRVTDPIIEANNRIFVAGRGTVRTADTLAGPLDFDIGIDTLTRLVFSSAAIGGITGIPSIRPSMTLMLD